MSLESPGLKVEDDLRISRFEDDFKNQEVFRRMTLSSLVLWLQFLRKEKLFS